MKILFVLLVFIGITSCGENIEKYNGETPETSQETLSKKYYISVTDKTGKEIISQDDQSNFSAEKLHGEATFGILESKLVLLDCWNNLGEEGVPSLVGKTFSANLTIKDISEEGLQARITEVNQSEKDDMFTKYQMIGTLDGDVKGKFRVYSFVMK